MSMGETMEGAAAYRSNMSKLAAFDFRILHSAILYGKEEACSKLADGALETCE